MIGRILGLYFARKMGQAVLLVFMTVFLLVYTIDLVELMRRAGETKGATTAVMAHLALLRTPSTAEMILPFSMLFGSLSTFITLSRKLELVVARAAGISAWQFVTPAIIVAFLVGCFFTLAYNPIASTLKERATIIEAKLFNKNPESSLVKGVWLRQRSVDGESILRAEHISVDENMLTNVTAFNLDRDGRFVERVEAPIAVLKQGFWRFENANVFSINWEPQTFERYLIASNLDADQLKSAVGPTQAVSFWSLPKIVSRLELAGLDSTGYQLKYQVLLARPVLLIAMVLVAASVSLKFLRSGGLPGMVMSGIAAGFVLYAATQIVNDMGGAGILSPIMAAWLVPITGIALGCLVLLYREDG